MQAFLSSSDAVVIAAILVAVPATISAVNAWQTRKQLKPNGGSSLRDAVDRIEVATIEHHADILDVKADMRETHGRLRSVESALRVATADRKDIAADLAATHTDL